MLLLNPPVYDTRLHWARWQQPTLLLRLASHYREAAKDVRLVDVMHRNGDERLRRERSSILDMDGHPVYRWRLGISRWALLSSLRGLQKSGWHPDIVYVEGFTTFWWEGAREAIEAAKRVFPAAQVILIGTYASLAPEHARTHTCADKVICDAGTALAHLPADLSLYPKRPRFTYLSLGNGARTGDEVVAEVAAKSANRGVYHFAFTDHRPAQAAPALLRSVLERLAERRLRVNLYALGSFAPEDLVSQPDLAALMKRAGFVQIHFSDDRDAPIGPESDEQLIDNYRRLAVICREAGFQLRTDALSAGLAIGRPGEDIAARAHTATMLAHHVGSVVLWPYQPSPRECPGVPLEGQNGKLFPLRGQNNLRYRDYMDLLGLGAVLSAKYRDHTFDFLGSGLIPQLVRDSFARRGWDPAPEVKGSLQLPMARR